MTKVLPNRGTVEAVAKRIFPGAESVSVMDFDHPEPDMRRMRVEMTGKIKFTFADMAALAEALNTDRLDFFSDPGDPGHQGSSWTGRYGEEDAFFAFEARWP
jgi:hypothetical protein